MGNLCPRYTNSQMVLCNMTQNRHQNDTQTMENFRRQNQSSDVEETDIKISVLSSPDDNLLTGPDISAQLKLKSLEMRSNTSSKSRNNLKTTSLAIKMLQSHKHAEVSKQRFIFPDWTRLNNRQKRKQELEKKRNVDLPQNIFSQSTCEISDVILEKHHRFAGEKTVQKRRTSNVNNLKSIAMAAAATSALSKRKSNALSSSTVELSVQVCEESAKNVNHVSIYCPICSSNPELKSKLLAGDSNFLEVEKSLPNSAAYHKLLHKCLWATTSAVRSDQEQNELEASLSRSTPNLSEQQLSQNLVGSILGFSSLIKTTWAASLSVLLSMAINEQQNREAKDLDTENDSTPQRRNQWVQCSGHQGVFAPAGPQTIWKRRDPKELHELRTYRELEQFNLSDLAPRLYREVEHLGECFLELEDLLHHFSKPHIMDIKMGTRTFLESEVRNPILRNDLYKKMCDINPELLTEEENQAQAVTKLRYMTFREQESTSASLGFRIDAIRKHNMTSNLELKRLNSKRDVATLFSEFFNHSDSAMEAVLHRVKYMRDKLQSSDFMAHRELIGSSLLMIHDDSGESGVWMIDFAKTMPWLEFSLDHRKRWSLGNHEDGYLFGFDNIIQIFEHLTGQASL